MVMLYQTPTILMIILLFVYVTTRHIMLPVGPEVVRFYYGTVGVLVRIVHPSLTFKYMVGSVALSYALICYVTRII